MTKTTTIKVLAIAILHFSFSILNSAAQAAVIDQVIVRQQWPWSTDVKIEYRLSGVTSPVDISVTAYNGTTPLDNSNINAALSGNRFGVTDSVGTIILDPVKAFGDTQVAIADFRVELELSDSMYDYDEVLYKIFCLTNNADVTTITRRDLMNGKYGAVVTNFANIGQGFKTLLDDVIIWTDVTNNPAYKDTHLVMRKIKAKNVLWTIGSPESEYGREFEGRSEAQHTVKLTQDYFIGVFEVTQEQYVRITDSSNPSNFKSDDGNPYRPVENVYYTTLRGARTESANGEKICWPTNSYKHAVYASSVCGKLRSKFTTHFDLPTEAQWEFACRAGTTNSLYNGRAPISNFQADVDELAWNSGNSASASSGRYTSGVGKKKPNAFGLYDMLGNVNEVCANFSVNDISLGGTLSDPLVDPDSGYNPNANFSRQIRGGCASEQARCSRSAHRGPANWADTGRSYYFGFRLVCPDGTTWED